MNSNLSGFYSPSGNEQFPEGSSLLPFMLPVDNVASVVPTGLVPSRHQAPTLDDPTIADTDFNKLFSGEGLSADGSELLSFALPADEVSVTVPGGLVPSRHQEPTRNDRSVRPLDLDKLFSKDLELTDAKGGIRSQKINCNLEEIANAIARRYTLAAVGNQLCL